MSDTPDFYKPIQYNWSKRASEIRRMAKEYSESTTGDYGPDKKAETTTCDLAALVKNYINTRDMWREVLKRQAQHWEDNNTLPEDEREKVRQEMKRHADDMLESNRYLLLAAAELWLRRRKLRPSKDTHTWWKYSGNDDQKCFKNCLLPAEVWDALPGEKRVAFPFASYATRELAMSAAIEAVAKCLQEGSLKDG